ncbi:hypothetical protein SAMN00120144_2097 [Hymenobacter roseosalivarius DSM 11622]|uniref:Secreted protein n=1 Tax=Hymenobacter roseosalivarius DSM 11622 TaxID=645990 RepID=A0A1W1VP89_9BACT|nr:hypothetical protein [Hymenobacter roseosalivarius]SMB94881.1 hypothetical protein SAMN00120144_2097 [Hymenobacter roseosalivarius DSM 11622]
MKRFLLSLLMLAFAVVAAQAQDLLTKQNGEELQVKVLEITPTEVRYKRTDNPDGPLISVRRTDVFMIRYASGTKEVFGPNQNAPQAAAVPSPPPGPIVPGDEESAYDEVHLNGPRVGFTVLSSGVLNKARRNDGLHDLNPFITQFGWQFETRIFRLPNGTAGLLEVVPLIGGLEQGKFIPSLNALIGIRGPKGLEFGVGPNLTPISAGVALAVGTSFRSNGINFPVNFAVVPGNGGARFSLLIGFNSRRR